MHILLTICTLDNHFVPDNNGYDYDFIVFYITLSTSFFSSAFGITNFLKLGPCRILPKKGFCGGFPLVMLSVGSVLVSKGISATIYLKISSNISGWDPVPEVWMLFNILPQVIHVSCS